MIPHNEIRGQRIGIAYVVDNSSVCDFDTITLLLLRVAQASKVTTAT
jgi:hypothetical protein